MGNKKKARRAAKKAKKAVRKAIKTASRHKHDQAVASDDGMPVVDESDDGSTETEEELFGIK
jgi:hypothetical protein